MECQVPITKHKVYLTHSEWSCYQPMMPTKNATARISGFSRDQLRLFLSVTCHWRVLNAAWNCFGLMLLQTTLVWQSSLRYVHLDDTECMAKTWANISPVKNRNQPTHDDHTSNRNHDCEPKSDVHVFYLTEFNTIIFNSETQLYTTIPHLADISFEETLDELTISLESKYLKLSPGTEKRLQAAITYHREERKQYLISDV